MIKGTDVNSWLGSNSQSKWKVVFGKTERRVLFDRILSGELTFEKAHSIYKKQIKGADAEWRLKRNFISAWKAELAKQKRKALKSKARALMSEKK